MKTADILTYKRTEEIKTEYRPEILLAVMGVLAGRVELWGTVMPTGISWVIANIKSEVKKQRLLVAMVLSAIGMLLGGIDIFRIRGIVTLGVLYAVSKFEIFEKNTLITAVFGAFVNSICGCIITVVTKGDSLSYIMLVIEGLLIVGTSVAFDNFISVTERGGSILSEDEGISMFVAAGVVSSGVMGLDIAGIRLSAIVGMYMVIFAARKCGLGISVTLGAVLGVVTGGDDVVSAFGMYVFLAIGCSLLRGMGKWGIIMGAALANAVYIACRFGLDNSAVRVIEIGVSATAFYFTPEGFINKVAEYTVKKSYAGISEGKLIQQKMDTEAVVTEIKNAISAVAEVVQDMNNKKDDTDNQWEIIKKVNSSVCSKCALKTYCIEKNRLQTEQAITYIIQLLKEKGTDVELTEKNSKLFSFNCIHGDKVIDKVKANFEFYLRREIEEEKKNNTRNLTVKGLDDISKIIERNKNRLSESCVSFDAEAEEINDALVRNGIPSFGVCVIRNRCGLFEVTAEIDSRFPGEAEKIIRGIMCISMKTVREEKTKKGTVLSMREKEHYEYETAVMSVDNKERCTGDTSVVFEDGRGFLHCMVSDGMGSGLLAARESGWTVKLYEKLCKAGFEPHEALRMINNIMVSANPGEACISCDGVKINLLTGKAEFAKAGAPSAYIKTGQRAEKLGWDSLPLGIIEIGSEEKRTYDVSEGGFIVLVSDGVPDTSTDRTEGENRIRRALEQCDGTTPGEVAESIMFSAMSMGISKDDMTVLVIKLTKK